MSFSYCAICFSSNNTQPNIILIMADDLGYDHIGALGSIKIKTPNIDSLANDGVKFKSYYSNGPVCSPSRAALMTGLLE
ncbi:sulfatase-like hydrolase/transferase [Lentisphaerota bacterium WC36G]|nr:sulfatase-like hydrolase/transferase [Lentisphaerae bacterium WC36]